MRRKAYIVLPTPRDNHRENRLQFWGRASAIIEESKTIKWAVLRFLHPLKNVHSCGQVFCDDHNEPHKPQKPKLRNSSTSAREIILQLCLFVFSLQTAMHFQVIKKLSHKLTCLWEVLKLQRCDSKDWYFWREYLWLKTCWQNAVYLPRHTTAPWWYNLFYSNWNLKNRKLSRWDAYARCQKKSIPIKIHTWFWPCCAEPQNLAFHDFN